MIFQLVFNKGNDFNIIYSSLALRPLLEGAFCAANSSNCCLFATKAFRYSFNPVPAGIKCPTKTFSFNPNKSSCFAFIAASVKTFVVSWNDAADK